MSTVGLMLAIWLLTSVWSHAWHAVWAAREAISSGRAGVSCAAAARFTFPETRQWVCPLTLYGRHATTDTLVNLDHDTARQQSSAEEAASIEQL